MTLFEAQSLTVERDGVRVVTEASLALAAGEIATIHGGSGSGKSTLLRALASLVPIATGAITLLGCTPRAMGLPAYRRTVSYVPQLPVMFEGSVADNVQTGPRLANGSPDDRAMVERLLATVGLAAALAGREAASLSGGERLRVALARSLANAPRVLLVDEPTAALDPEAAAVVTDALVAVAELGTTLVVVTHVGAHAARLADRKAKAPTRYRMESGVLTREPT